MKRSELCAFLSDYLEIADFSAIDPSMNGLVVSSPGEREVRKVATAVDASLSTFAMAGEWGADLLFVHHGLFWGHPLPVTGTHYERLRSLMERNLDLFACHLPLDAHEGVGNNAQMARLLSLDSLTPFAPWRGKPLGWWGRSEKPLSPLSIARALGFLHPVILPFGKEEIHSVGFVSGDGSGDLEQALALHLDCFVTGVVRHEQYALCREARMNMVGGGHYQSEVFGVQAVAALLEERFTLETKFLANPTGL